jgi:hypothetical protein
MIGNPKKITSQPVVPQAETIFWHIPNSSNSYVFGFHYHKNVVDLPSLGVFLNSNCSNCCSLSYRRILIIHRSPVVTQALGLARAASLGRVARDQAESWKTSDFAMETTKKAAISKANIIFQIFQFLLRFLSVLWSVGFQCFTQEPTWQGEHNSLPDKLGAQHKMTRGLERKSKICPQF